MRPAYAAITAWLNKRRDEASNSFVLFIVMMPLIMSAFGIGLDMTRNAYIRATIQNNLELAAVGGASTATPDSSGHVTLNSTEAIAALEQVYAANRGTNGFLTCTGDHAAITNSNATRCWKVWGTPVVTSNHISYGVIEVSRNAFLPTVGIPTQTYHVKADARVAQDTQ